MHPDLQYVGPLPKRSATSMATGSTLNTFWRRIQTQVVNAYAYGPQGIP